MMEHIYTRMRSRSVRLLRKEDCEMLLEKSAPEIIEFLKPHSRFYRIFSQEYALFYSSEDLISIISKGRYLSPLLEFKGYAELLNDDKAKVLLDSYLYQFKSKILMVLLAGLYSNKPFEEIKSLIITTPAINKVLEARYAPAHVYDLTFMLLDNKEISIKVQDFFNKGDFDALTKLLQMSRLEKLNILYDTFKEEDFIRAYIYYEILDICLKLENLHLELESNHLHIIREINKFMKDKGYAYKILKRFFGEDIGGDANKRVLDKLKSMLYKKARDVFMRHPFTYSALLGYVLLLEREFRVVNLIAKYKIYGEKIGEEKIRKTISECYD